MGRKAENFDCFELPKLEIGSYEHQVKVEFEHKIECLQKDLDDLKAELIEKFG